MNQAVSMLETVPAYDLPQPDENNKRKNRYTFESNILNNSPVKPEETKPLNKFTKKKNKRFAEMNNELNSFSYISSHDLQEPLRKIQTFSSRILEKELHNLSEQGKEYFNRMQNAAKRMQALIHDLALYSKLTASEKEFQRTDLNLILDQVQNDLQSAIEEKKVVIECGSLCTLNVIPFQFRQLMHNILSNSLKFSDPEKQLHVIIKAKLLKENKLFSKKNGSKKACYHISISDNGIGFDPQYSKKIFEVFQRLNGKDEYEGTGIGLAICKRIVENHKGVIRAGGELKKGAFFDIYLPAD